VNDEAMARLVLAGACEPGDPRIGQALAGDSAVAVVRRLADGDPDLPARPGVGSAQAVAAMRALDLVGARWVVPGESEWPTQLDQLGVRAPFGIWVLGGGDLRLLALRSVAIVGARACTAYGAECAGELAYELVQAGLTIVSGGAYGIDAAAHRGALAGGGASAAVLAAGPDLLQPRGNESLFRAIAADGVLVGELPCGVRPRASRLLQRNRMIAALSRGTVVVEAAARSGARRTAADARRLNRPVMAVPGPISSAVSAGCHAEIRDGSTLVASAAQIREMVEPVGSVLAAREADPEPGVLAQRLLALLPARGGVGLDRLVTTCGSATADVLAGLDELAAAGLVLESADGWRLATVRRG
jgi:DNA processing protein